MDFGVDQLDIKKAMKPKLGPNITLRLRFGEGAVGAVGGGGGYDIIATKDDTNVEMVSIDLNDRTGGGKINTDDTIDSSSTLLKTKTTEI